MKKVLYVATVASHICQFHLPYLEVLQKNGYQVQVAARNNLAEKNGLSLKFCDEYFDVPFERSPLKKRNLTAFKKLKNIIKENNYDLIVCNTPMGGILTRLAARKSRKKGTKVIYIAHGFHFYKNAPKKYWIVFYPIEKFFARLCDMVITINYEDYELAKAKFKTDVRHIHGIGVSSDRYHTATDEERETARGNLGLKKSNFANLCTGELNKNKNQEELINAAAILSPKIKDLKILLAGNGPNEENLLNQINGLNLQDTVKLLGYRTDLEKVMQGVDLVVSCSRREGLGLNLIEAMLSSKPVVAAYNRGHKELIVDGLNGYLVSPDDAEDLATKIFEIYSDDEKKIAFSTESYKKAMEYTVSSVKKELVDDIILKIMETK